MLWMSIIWTHIHNSEHYLENCGLDSMKFNDNWEALVDIS